MNKKNSVFNKLYIIFISVLAVSSIVLAVMDLLGKIDLLVQPYHFIDNIILVIFTIDYGVRFYLSDARKHFFKENIFDLLAIIPFSSIFSMFRVFRVFRIFKAAKIFKFMRLLRAGAFVGVLKKRIQGIINTNGFVYVLYVNLALIFCSSIVMMYAESMTFEDALWWSIVTCTTVGYGDISPSSGIGRIVAVILMIFGIGLLGMLTGAITTYFTQPKTDKESDSSNELQKIFENASDEERQKIIEVAKIIIKK